MSWRVLSAAALGVEMMPYVGLNLGFLVQAILGLLRYSKNAIQIKILTKHVILIGYNPKLLTIVIPYKLKII